MENAKEKWSNVLFLSPFQKIKQSISSSNIDYPTKQRITLPVQHLHAAAPRPNKNEEKLRTSVGFLTVPSLTYTTQSSLPTSSYT